MQPYTITEFMETVEKETAQWQILAPGIALGCPDCNTEFYRDLDEIPETVQEDVKDEFSAKPCDCCGSRLAGYREPAHAVSKNEAGIFHLEICQDCTLYLANGEVPEYMEDDR